jgi:hypothetical protein
LPAAGSVECKVRTRLADFPGLFTESAPRTWNTAANIAMLSITGISPVVPINLVGCDTFAVEVELKNPGNRSAFWRIRGCAVQFPGTDADCHWGDDNAAGSASAVLHLLAGATKTVSLALANVPLSSNPDDWAVIVRGESLDGTVVLQSDPVPVARDDTSPPLAGFDAVYGPLPASAGQLLLLRLSAQDDHRLAGVGLDWRPGTGPWLPVEADIQLEPCSAVWQGVVPFSVPGYLAQGASVELRLTAEDASGHQHQEVYSLEVGPEIFGVSVVSPVGQSQLSWAQSDTEDCLPVEFLVTGPAVPEAIQLFYTDAAHEARQDLSFSIVPALGRHQICVPFGSLGSSVILGVEVVDSSSPVATGFSEPFSVTEREPSADWSTVRAHVLLPNLAPPPTAVSWQGKRRFLALENSGSGFAFYRHDNAHWQAQGQWFQSHELRKWTLHATNLTLTGSEVLLPTAVQSSQPDEGLSPLLCSREGNRFFQIDVRRDDGCVNPEIDPCQVSVYERTIGMGAFSPWRLVEDLGVLPPQAVQTPDTARGEMLLVDGEFPVLFLPVGGTTRVYRLVAGAWTKVIEFPGRAVRDAAVGARVWVLLTDQQPGAWSLRVQELKLSSGVMEPPSFLLSGEGNLDSADLVLEPGGAVAFLVAVDDSWAIHLARFMGGNWTLAGTFPASDLFQHKGWTLQSSGPHAAYSSGALVGLTCQVQGDGMPEKSIFVSLPVDPLGGPQPSQAVVSSLPVDPATRLAAITSAGRIVRMLPDCFWDGTLAACFQISRPLAGCDDNDPCTTDLFDFSTQKCRNVAEICVSDGNHCNGPEQCDPLIGTCRSMTELGPECDDGVFCNGVESCHPTIHVCVPGTAPAVGDRPHCVVPVCIEEQNLLVTGADHNRCLAAPCMDASCQPDNPDSNPISGCVQSSSPIPQDALPCTLETCHPVSGTWSVTVEVGFCAVSDGCVAAGSFASPSSCTRCDPGNNPWGFVPASDGTPCEDGRWCTVGDSCFASVCKPGPPRPCQDAGDGCEAQHCDLALDGCVGTPLESGTPCGIEPSCLDGVVTILQACDGLGLCSVEAGYQQSCTPYATCRSGSECSDQCFDVFDCVSGAVCTGGLCRLNEPPVADAGADQIVDEGSAVTLNGTFSWDADEDPVTYTWHQISGPLVTLSETTSATPQFDAPWVASETAMIFQLLVNDGYVDSEPSLTRVTVLNNMNDPPVANAGPDQVVNEGDVVYLDGTRSTDPNGDPLSYSWSFQEQTSVALDDPLAPTPSFVAHVGGQSQGLTLVLIVNDGKMNSAPDQVLVSVLAKSVPVDDAEEDVVSSPETVDTYDPGPVTPTGPQKGADPYDPLACDHGTAPRSAGWISTLLALAVLMFSRRLRSRKTR